MRHSAFRCAITGALLLLLEVGNAAAQEKLQAVGRADANQDIEFEVYLPLQHSGELDQLLAALHTPGSPVYHKWLTPTEFHDRFGAKSEDIARVADALKAAGLEITNFHSHGLHIQGKVSDVESAFGVQLSTAVTATGHPKLVADQVLILPTALNEAGAQIAHFSPYIRMRRNSQKLEEIPANRYSPIGGYWFDDLKQAYDYPSYKKYTGNGVTIGILMVGGYNPPDMDKYFGHELLATPKISEVDLFGAPPYDPTNPFNSFETHLDIQQSGGMAPGAHIVLFNIPDLSDATILAGLTTIIEGNSADVVNMSFGGPEIGYLPDYNNGVNTIGLLGVYDDLFRQGTAQGITFVASSGDLGAFSIPAAACFASGATSSCGGFVRSVEIPASSPHVTGVGGTNLVTTYNPPSLDSAYVKESAFPDPLALDIFYGTPATGGLWGSGGGISIYYKKPIYQFLVNSPSKYRTVPDLALHMGGCPQGAVAPCGPDRSYDIEALGGHFYGVIGTSASSPDFAGLTALNIERFGTRMGNENFYIYALAASQSAGILPFKVYHDNIPGSNGYFHTQPGYNMVLGNGTLFGKNFILAPPNVPAAGVPQTPTNP
jgi:subtilase family serine protease